MVCFKGIKRYIKGKLKVHYRYNYSRYSSYMKWYAKTLLNCIYSRYAEVKGALKMYKYKQYSKPKKT